MVGLNSQIAAALVGCSSCFQGGSSPEAYLWATLVMGGVPLLFVMGAIWFVRSMMLQKPELSPDDPPTA